MDSPHQSNKDVLFSKLSESWESRAQLRCHHLENELQFDPDKEDFLTEKIFFHTHPLFQKLDTEQKGEILSLAWLAYNQTTIDIENAVVRPLCMKILLDNVPGAMDFLTRDIIAKTIVDEEYHILLTLNASEITRKHRSLTNIEIPRSGLLINMKLFQDKQNIEWKKTITQLAACIISEIFIGAQLSEIAKSDNPALQPINKTATLAHMMDEKTHGRIFHHLACNIYVHLGAAQKEFFKKVLAESVYWFITTYHSSWELLLSQIKFKNREILLREAQPEPSTLIDSLDCTPIENLCQELEISSFEDRLRELCQTRL